MFTFGKGHKLLTKELPPKSGETLITQREALEIGRFDKRALSIIASSEFTTHDRYGPHRAVRASNILNDFFRIEHFRGKTILEFGPGHYSFALLARRLGAKLICVEKYTPHVELGNYLGFEVLDLDFLEVTPELLGRQVDGFWMKGAFNACRFRGDDDIRNAVRQMTSLVHLNGWGWCVTVNKASASTGQDPVRYQMERIELQKDAFLECGWNASPIEESDRKRYALSYAGARYMFTRNLLGTDGSPCDRPIATNAHRT